jgi:apolipoprotein N-acyltransferase
MKCYFNTYYIKLGLIISLFLSLPIYLIHFGIDNKLLNSIVIIIGFIIIYKNDKKATPWIGFFMSIFWLWWISLSFRYYNLSILIPFIIFGIGVFYWFIFYIISFLPKIFVILFIIFGIGYIKPFGFNWFDFKYILPHTYFYIPNQPQKPSTLKIKTIHTHIPQDKKWDKNFIPIEIQNNFSYIKKAIKKYEVIVLPESVFPIPINQYPKILNKLKNLSKQITIITGALEYKNNKYYNSTYLFKNGKVFIYHKHILVPFGEYIPIECCKTTINKIFFNGANDYTAEKDFNSYKIKNIKFLNAICYEVTNEKLYKKSPKYIIAMSNNAWFKPSIEITLQKMIIEYYSSKYKKYVYHSVNY